MAISDILGLFASPQQYEQQRQAAMEAQALQTARHYPLISVHRLQQEV